MAIGRLAWSSLISVVYFAFAYAGDDGGWESKSCQPVTTTMYSVSTSYYEKTVWSTNVIYLTDTVTKVQVQQTTIAVPTTVVNQQTITQVDLSTVVNLQTVTRVDLSTIVNQLTTTVISNIPGPTTTVSACPTTPLVGLVTCSSRIVNPTYTASKPLPSDHLWGCPIDTLCTPPQIDCNFEQNLPADTYVCAPEECKPVPPRAVPEDFVPTWPTDTDADCAWYTPSPGFFNLNPKFFGLDFDIFDIYGQPVCPPAAAPTTTGWSDWSSSQPPAPTTTAWSEWNAPAPSHTYTPRMVRRGVRSWNPLSQIKKRQFQVAPQECYGTFNAAALIAQSIGKDYPQLCPDGSEFQNALGECTTCADTYSTGSTATSDIDGLQDFYLFCLSPPANSTA